MRPASLACRHDAVIHDRDPGMLATAFVAGPDFSSCVLPLVPIVLRGPVRGALGPVVGPQPASPSWVCARSHDRLRSADGIIPPDRRGTATSSGLCWFRLHGLGPVAAGGPIATWADGGGCEN
jgi:hypothetical protein